MVLTSGTDGIKDTQSRTKPIDPEVDADDALRALRKFVIDDAPEDSPSLEQWPALDSYLEELCSFGVDRLTREPHDLTAVSLRLKNDLEDVACSNYRALIESFECADAVREGVTRVKLRLNNLVGTLPELAEATRQFSTAVTEQQNKRECRLRSLAELRAVSDILEMPRLMGTLVASELYDEALELRDHALKLSILHPDDNLINGVCDEVHVLTQQMVLQLLVLLRNAVQLPTCLRVIGFLRRLRLFSEFRLRMLFLHCRAEWMRTGIESTVASSRQAYLVNLSDNTRAMVFEIVTQYRAVFSDDEEDMLDTVTDGDISFANGSRPVSSLHSSAILFDWTASCASEYLRRLEDGVGELPDGAALNTVLQQAMYCGQSLGRIGADFRAALPPMFEEAVMRIFSSHLNAALRQFEMMIEDNRWAPVGSSALRKERGYSMTASMGKYGDDSQPDGDKDDDEMSPVPSKDPFEPPSGVLDSPALAVFLNGILVALNDLRLCAPISLSHRIGGILQQSLIRAGEYMSAMGGPGGAFLKRSDRPHFISMSLSLRDLCVRHAARCLNHCMNCSGLVDLSAVDKALTDVFGDSLSPNTLSTTVPEQPNGSDPTSDPQHDADDEEITLTGQEDNKTESTGSKASNENLIL